MIINIDNLFLNVVLVMFPILFYFIFECYSSLKKKEKYNDFILNILLITSLYLIIKYSRNYEMVLFLDIPLIIAYLKHKNIMGIIISIIIIFFSIYRFDINIYLLFIKYIGYYFISYFYNKRSINEYKLIFLISIWGSFFVSFSYFISTYNIVSIIDLFITGSIFYLISIMVFKLFIIGDRVASLYMTSAELERNMQLKNSLFKIIHEVKNPIAVCKGYLDMLDTDDYYKIKKYIPIINDEINRSLNIMNDFMEFSKIKIDKDILDIDMLISDVVDEMKIVGYGKVKINYTENDEENYINGDYCRLKQVLINVIKNSIEAIEDNGKIDIKGYSKRKYYYIEVIDNGIGMSKEVLDKIDELFFTTKVRGSGLGVSLSNEIIKAHNGTIKYSSIVNKGTKVIIKIPLYSC